MSSLAIGPCGSGCIFCTISMIILLEGDIGRVSMSSMSYPSSEVYSLSSGG